MDTQELEAITKKMDKALLAFTSPVPRMTYRS